MAHESFEDADIAAQMNAGFVCVKVDREERPDLDDIYMAATMAMNHGQGGWPMTVFLTPDQRPFFAGTYFPPADRHGRPGFPAILRRITELWRDNRPALARVGAELATHLRQAADSSPGPVDLDAAFARLLDQLTGTFDPAWGGFGRAPKFPPATLLRLLLILHRRGDDGRALPMVRRTLDGMARGGMYDQIGGGFSRYATDDQWLVPHFEKMLYDNALLTRAYLEGYQVTGDPFYRTIATEVLDYILREMTAPEGGFYSATDADSEGVEGKFFVWTRAEFEAVLGPEAALAAAWFDVTEMGNWEGHSIPRTPRLLGDVAAELGIDPQEAAIRLASARERLYAARLKRIPPGLDDKVLTSWNGLMIGAMAEGARVLGEPRYLEGAARAADFVLAELRDADGRLLRSWRRGAAHLNGYLEDYAFLGNGLLDLYEAGGGERHLAAAQSLAARILADFAAPDGGLFSTSADHEALLVRHREGHDGAVPAANAAAAHLLARLAAHDGRDDWRAAAESALEAWGAVDRAGAPRVCAEPRRAGLPAGGTARARLRRAPGRRRARRPCSTKSRATSCPTASSPTTTPPQRTPNARCWPPRPSWTGTRRSTSAAISPAGPRSPEWRTWRPRSASRAAESGFPRRDRVPGAILPRYVHLSGRPRRAEGAVPDVDNSSHLPQPGCRFVLG